MGKEQNPEQSDSANSRAKPMSFPLEAFLKKLKKEQREKARGADKE